MPFSVRQPVKSIKDVKMTNHQTGTVIHLPIRKEITEAIRDFKSTMKGVISRLEPFASGRVVKLTGTFPFTVASYAINYLTTKCTLCFTNLNASKVAYKWAGKEAKNIFVLA